MGNKQFEMISVGLYQNYHNEKFISDEEDVGLIVNEIDRA